MGVTFDGKPPIGAIGVRTSGHGAASKPVRAKPRVSRDQSCWRAGQDLDKHTGEGEGLVVDHQLQKLMKQLGDAINETLSDSEQIAEVIGKIKAGGYDVFLVLEATIGFNKRDEDEDEAVENSNTPRSSKSDPDFKVSPQDVKFLRSLRISVNDDSYNKRDKAA